MRLQTTTIGAFPKPDFVPISDWFQGAAGPDTVSPTVGYAAQMSEAGAKVLHAGAVDFARRAKITIHARSTFEPGREQNRQRRLTKQ